MNSWENKCMYAMFVALTFTGTMLLLITTIKLAITEGFFTAGATQCLEESRTGQHGAGTQE